MKEIILHYQQIRYIYGFISSPSFPYQTLSATHPRSTSLKGLNTQVLGSAERSNQGANAQFDGVLIYEVDTQAAGSPSSPQGPCGIPP